MKKNNFEIAEEAKDEPRATDTLIIANKPICFSMSDLAIYCQLNRKGVSIIMVRSEIIEG